MDVTPQIYIAKVMHKRLFPKVNQFTYGVYYLALPLPTQSIPSRWLSFRNKDYGARKSEDVSEWAKTILNMYGVGELVTNIMLITMPRVLGYAFNPVSFYLCLDSSNHVRAVICEVNNTFGEHHSYVCARSDHAPISPDEWLEAEKVFHVSPFLSRNGHYKFRFALSQAKLGIWIDYYDAQQNKQLLTSLTGSFVPLDAKALRRVFWSHPLVTFKVITLIHWQAIKLVSKGIRYISKPLQLLCNLSSAHNLTKQ